MTNTDQPPRNSDDVQGETIADLLGSGDHKSLGRLYVIASITFLVGAMVVGVLYGIERMDTADDLFIAANLTQLFASYRMGLLLLVALPLALGLGTFIVPLQVGASTIAFPRAAAAAFWGWLISAGLMIAAFGIEGGPDGISSDGVDLWALATIGVAASLTLGVICVVTTVLGLRVNGLHLVRVPAFSWSMLVAGTLWILTLPVLAVNLGLIWLDHSHGNTMFGQSGSHYSQVAWIFTQPALYIAAIPVLGIVADMIPVASRGVQKGHGVVLGAIGAFGALSFGAWVQPAFSGPVTERFLFIVMPFAIFLTVLVLFGGFAATAFKNKPKGFAPLVAATLGLLAIEIGLILGMLHVIDPLDLLGTSFATGQMNLVLIGSVIGLIGGLQYWGPKMFGTKSGNGALGAAAGLAFIGALLAGIADVVSGFAGQPDGVINVELTGDLVDNVDTVELMNLLSMVGIAIVAVASLGMLFAVMGLASNRTFDVEDNPWGGNTLEWATTSPPPFGNFTSIPEVTSAAPLFEAPEGELEAAEAEEELVG